MDSEFIYGQMEGDMKENGNKENSMGRENIYYSMGRQELEYGKMESVLNGQMKMGMKKNLKMGMTKCEKKHDKDLIKKNYYDIRFIRYIFNMIL